MIDFYEYLARAVRGLLDDPVATMDRLGISRDVPHDIDLMKLVKDGKRREAQMAKPAKFGPTPRGPLRVKARPRSLP